MSQSETDVELEQYRTTAGVESKFADVASEEHALKERFGSDEEAKRIEFEAEIIGERVAQWYDDPAAAIREYLSNAETACIRRAKGELESAGLEAPRGVTDLLELAAEKCDYQPVIEVTYNRKPESTRLVIEDNGVGISTDEYLVLKKIGYSTSHMDGERLGQFGMGYMSGFQLTGTRGTFNMRTRSFLTDETYSTANYITNFEYLDGLKESYGTRFEFPSFCDKAETIDVRDKVEEFAEGMRVTVLYREMDDSGQEVFNEDYTPSALADDYDDSALVIQYENEHFEAVMSPHSPERRGYKTYNISMPIRRNTSKYGTEPKFNAPWSWDFRGKSENGPVVHSESDSSVVGLAPVSDSKYESMPDERKDKFMPRSELPDDAIVMPTPASSRDSYESGHDDFWRYVSDCLFEEWKGEVADRIGSLDDFDDFRTADSREKHIIVRGYRKFGPGYGENSPDTVVDHFEKVLNISLDKDVAKKLDKLTNSHLVVNRDAPNPSYKSETSKTKTWKIIDSVEPDGTVYMGKSISPKKAEIAWDLHDDNVIVRLEEADYEELEELWGWSKLKDLPSRNLKEKLPNLSDDVAEKWESVSTSSNSGTSSGANVRTSRDPRSKRIKVYGKKRRTSRSYRKMTAGDVYDVFDNDESLNVSHKYFNRLIVFDQNERSVSYSKKFIKRSAGVAVAVVPRYVYKFLSDADNVYTSEAELRKQEAKDATVTLSGDREVNITSIPDDELIFVNAGSLEEHFDEDSDELREFVESETGESYSHVSFVDSDDFNRYHWTEPEGGTIFRFSGYSGPGKRFRIDGKKQSPDDVVEHLLVPDDIDWDHDVMRAINRGVRRSADKKMTVVKYLKKHDALPTVSDD